MSVLVVMGAMSALISSIDASIKVFDSAQHDSKLPRTFEVVGRRLPVLLNTLETCKSHLDSKRDTIPEDVCKALEKNLEVCAAKASNLRGIFEKVLPGESDTRKRRYSKTLYRLGQGNKVEELMESIVEDVQLIVNHDIVQPSRLQQNSELEQVIEEMKSVKPSLPDDELPNMDFTSGGGVQMNNFNGGSGQQINNNASVGIQHFSSGKKLAS